MSTATMRQPGHPVLGPDATLPPVPGWYERCRGTGGRLGDRADRLAPYLMHGDPPADALVTELAALPAEQRRGMVEQAIEHGIDSVSNPPAALVEFFRELEEVPPWVDWDRLNRGGSVVLRSGPAGGVVLLCAALPLSYLSPDGNKPLVITGRLVTDTACRLAETARFLVETARKDGLRRSGKGFEITVKVRLMHAQVRWLLLQDERWQLGEWGMPINQVYLAGTNTLFSGVFLRGLRKLGMRYTDAEGEDLVHLWRYSGRLFGVYPDLCAPSPAEGEQLFHVLTSVWQAPDEDSVTLVRALMDTHHAMAQSSTEQVLAKAAVPFSYAVSRYLIGDRFAKALRYPRSAWQLSVPAVRAMLRAVSTWQRFVPQSHPAMERAGLRSWELMIETGLRGQPATFEPPTELPRA